jgi:hypothetical protein
MPSVPYANRIGRIYGYLVCVIAIGVFLASASSIVGTLYDRANPLNAQNYGDVLTSFDGFKASHGNENPAHHDNKASAAPDTLTDAALRQTYNALVANRMSQVRFETAKTLGTSGLLLLLSIGLFTVHWWWVRRLREPEAAA